VGTEPEVPELEDELVVALEELVVVVVLVELVEDSVLEVDVWEVVLVV